MYMCKFNTNLKGTDLTFLYGILYQHEKETKHKGYDYTKIDKQTRDSVKIINKTKTKKVVFAMPISTNTIVINARSICVPLLTHLRHALAHACIEKVGNEYIINQKCNPKCRICGRVNVFTFKKYINAMIATRTFN